MARKPSRKKLVELIQLHGGILTDMAESCGVSRQSVHAWIKKDPTLKNEIDDARDLFVDLAKKGLKYHLEQQSEKTIHFTLDRLAQKEGFGKLIQIKDKSKFEDQFDDLSDEELEAMLKDRTDRLTN